MVERHALEIGGQMHFAGFIFRELPEGVFREGGRAMLDGSAEPVGVRAMMESFFSVSKSTATCAILPFGSTTPPCEVPV